MFTRMKIMFPLLAFLLFGLAVRLDADFVATDPGVRGDPAGAGDPIDGISENERKFFVAGLEAFREVQSVQGGTIEGEETEPSLGPLFNLDSCAGCHAQPAVGGTSPFTNPQVDVANKAGATNVVPDFIIKQGPVREARFKFNPDGTRDGGVHDLFTITGRTDAVGCNIAQPDFKAAEANNNLIFRIPTPLFGAGLIQAIDDSTILANKNSNVSAKLSFGISGRVNRNPNDGTITRFGWKAQVKSLDLFSGEFLHRFGRFAGAVAHFVKEESDDIPMFSPVNEINFFAWPWKACQRQQWQQQGPCSSDSRTPRS